MQHGHGHYDVRSAVKPAAHRPEYTHFFFSLLLLTAIALLISCNSGGDGSTETTPSFPPASDFKAQCDSPRSGTNPSTGNPYPDVQGSVLLENQWLRSWSHDTYLWYDEINYPDPANYNSPPAYFDLLKTNALTPSGNPKDRFHFTYPTEVWLQLSQSGVSVGYGAQWVIISPAPPREVLVAYVEPATPAADAGLVRGTEILSINGVSVIDGDDVTTLNNGLFPQNAGESYEFTVMDRGASDPRTFSMTSANIAWNPVGHVTTIPTAAGDVGYILFNDHNAPAEEGLIDAIDSLSGVDELVLDIRYNGGGYLAIASQLAYMIAGEAQTDGEIFEAMRFNDKHPFFNPVTGALLFPWPFIDETTGMFTLPGNQPLPSLDLSRVFVLTGPNTCSASESIINSLRGIDVDVIQIGSTTCGKPYGFYATDNCGTTYFTIQFKGENAVGFGDYGDGFSPANTPSGSAGTLITGCSVADDYQHDLGDPDEGRLSVALAYINGAPCPAATGISPLGLSASGDTPAESTTDGYTPKPLWLQNRIMDH